MFRSVVVAGLLAAFAVAPARAALVTFDDASAPTGGYFAGESFSDQGLTFTYGASGTGSMYLYDASGFGPAPGSNGTNTLLIGATRTDLVTITLTGGGLFSISSLLLGISEPNQAETTDAVFVNGTSRAITNTASLYAVSTGNVQAVTISGLVNGGFVSLDNITYQVPEPASIALLGVGLAGLATFARQRRDV